jgi:hypothetical protein
MRSTDRESGAELPATLWEALLYDAVDSTQVLQVHQPENGIVKRLRDKYGDDEVEKFRQAFAENLRTRAKDKRVFRGTANAFLIFGNHTGPTTWTFRYRDTDFDIGVRTIKMTLGAKT